MDIEKTYELMNQLEVYKNLFVKIRDLNLTKADKYFKYDHIYFSIEIFDQIKEKQQLVKDIKHLLQAPIELRIKELEKEIKAQ